MRTLIKSTAVAALAAVSTLAAGQAGAAPHRAAPHHAAPQASIPFVSYGGIRDWRAYDTDTLYVQDQHRRWYRAELFAPCFDLPFAQAIGFETRGVDTFDRFSTVRVRGQSCHLQSLVRIDGPPKKPDRRHG